MFRSLRCPPPWKTAGYVCRSCRHQLQSSRRFESTAAAATEAGGEDDWYENFNTSAGRASEKGGSKVEKNKTIALLAEESSLAQSHPEPRTRRSEPDHPAVRNLLNTSTEALRAGLRRDRRKLADLQRPKATAVAARQTAFTKRGPNQQGELLTLLSHIGLFERVLELRREGVLSEPTQLSKESVAGEERTISLQSTGTRIQRRARISPLAGRWGAVTRPSPSHSLQLLEERLNTLEGVLAAKRPEAGREKEFESSDHDSIGKASVSPTVSDTAFTSGAKHLGPSLLRSRIVIYKKVIDLRRRGELPGPIVSNGETGKDKQSDNTNIDRQQLLAKSQQKAALWDEIRELHQTLTEEFGLENLRYPPYRRSVSGLRHSAARFRILLQQKREARASHGEAEHSGRSDEQQIAGSLDGSSANDGLTHKASIKPTKSGLDAIVTQLKQRFQNEIKGNSNASEVSQQTEPADSATNRNAPHRKTSAVEEHGNSDLVSLSQRLERDIVSNNITGSVASAQAKGEKDTQSQSGDDLGHSPGRQRLSMPQFAAASSQTPVSSAIGAGRLTVAQKVREARDRPKWGLFAATGDGRATQAAESDKPNTKSVVGKHSGNSKLRVPTEDREDEAAFFADSPGDLAERQASSISQSPSSSEEKPRATKSEYQNLGSLRQSLGIDIGGRERSETPAASGRERSEDEERMKTIEQNIKDYDDTAALSSPSAEASSDQDASESLASLHRFAKPNAIEEAASLVKDKTPEANPGISEQSNPAKPVKTGGRKSPHRLRAEKKRGATAVPASSASSVGGDDGESGEHRPLWKVMENEKPASMDDSAVGSLSEQETKTPESEIPPLELPGNAPPVIATVKAADLHIDALNIPQPPVPGLEYGLDRVLFNPGVFQLQDPTSRVYNFDPYLQDIMPAVEFDFNALKEYKTSSEDKALSAIAKEHQKRYIGSTSSMTSTLAHFHYLLSNWRPLNLDMLSRAIPDKADEFTKINRAPNAIFLRWKPESKTYAIDADKEYDGANVLMMLGKSMEKLLTLPTFEFEKYRKSDPREVSQEARDEPEAFQYTTMGDFLMRSQLDAYDPRLPGTGMFDLKTRAVLSVRMDAEDFEPMMGYEIHTLQGKWNSYEREYYDMMRSTMLKYMLQARMGRMQGIFAAYHNIQRIFGFQYIPMMDMDRAIHGQIDPCLGDQEFKLSLELLNKVLDKATAKFPEKSLRLHFETGQQNLGGENPASVMSIFAEPMEENEINRIQSSSKEKVRQFEQKVMDIDERQTSQTSRAAAAEETDESEDQPPTEYPPATPEPSSGEPEATEQESEEDSVPTTYPPVTPEPPSSSSSNPDLSSSSSAADSSFLSSLSSPSSSKSDLAPLFAATLLTKSRINGDHVNRPSQLKRDDDWTVEYLLTEYPETEATWARYVAVKGRRREVFVRQREEEEGDVAVGADANGNGNGEAGVKKDKKRDGFIEFLREVSKRGREFRKEMDAAERGREKKFAWKQPNVARVESTVVAGGADEAKEAAVRDVGDYMGWLYGERGRKA